MRYLIDTNLLINLVEDDFISNDVSNIVDDYENSIDISFERKAKIPLPENRYKIKKSAQSFFYL
jgi:hypothetical protein